MRRKCRQCLLPLSAALGLCARSNGQESPSQAETERPAESLWTRSKLTGNWWEARDSLASKGVTFDITGVYTFQGVTAGGIGGTPLARLSEENDTGNTLFGDLEFGLDTEKAGMWAGGSFDVQLEARTGRSVVQRAGTVSPVNNAATYPNVQDCFDEDAFAVTQVCYTQYFGEAFGVYGGLLNTAEGDANDIAGSGVSNSHFLNSAMLYSLVEDASAANVSLGGGLLFQPCERLSGSISATTTSELAGESLIGNAQGLTLGTEWTLTHKLFDLPGAQTAGFLYGTGVSRTNIAANPRVVIGSVLSGSGVPTTSADTWAFYYNVCQFLHGDVDRGWGLFARFGISDGNPNPVKWNLAGGVGGVGTFQGRDSDRWGAGVYYLDMSNEDLLSGLNVEQEFGGEAFYSIAVAPWWHITLDGQAIDSALPIHGTTVVLGVRVVLDF